MTAIDDKYAALGGPGGFLGSPTSPEFPCSDGIGTFRHFQSGSIYWSPATGAHEVHGAIRDLWAELNWELGPMGYPTSDEKPGPMSVARTNSFQHGSIFWDIGRGAYEVFPRPAFPDPDPAIGGQWEVAPFSSQVVGMHAALLDDSRVLFLGYLEPMDHMNPGPVPSDHGESAVVDLLTGAAVEPGYTGPFHMLPNIFCSGHAWLPDGRWLIAGGDREAQERVRALHVYDPSPVRAGGGEYRYVGQCAQGRWYVTCVTLPDGRVVLVGGEKRLFGDPSSNINIAFETFDPWTESVGGELLQPAMLGVGGSISYPFVYVLPDRRLLVHGGTQTTIYSLPHQTFTGTAIEAMARPDRWVRTYGAEGSSVLLALRPQSDPPYAAKVMMIGGGGPGFAVRVQATSSCEILDTSAPSPVWQAAASLHHGRVMPDSVLLPDGTVLTVSGSSRGHADNGANPEWATELYDPEADTWTEMATSVVPRLYHSTALLLPDGRVMTAGSDSLWNPEPFHHPEMRIELFSPPYLFAGPRPVTSDVPGSIRPGAGTFVVGTPDGSDVDTVVLMRVGSSTHSFNSDQRLVELVIAASDASGVTVEVPPDGYVAPPGPYLLFLLRDGIPSVGRYLTVEVEGVFGRRAPVHGAVRKLEHIDLFATDRDGQVRTASWEPAFGPEFHGWTTVVGDEDEVPTFPPDAPVHAVSRSTDHLDIFATDDTGAVLSAAWESAFVDGWHGWWPIAGGQAPPGAAVTAVSRRPDRLDIFVVAANGHVMTTGWEPFQGWAPWAPVGGALFPPGSTVNAVSRSLDKLDLFGVDVNGAVLTAAWEPANADGWHGWWQVAGGQARPGAPVLAISRNTDFLDVFVTADDGQVKSAYWRPDSWGWQGWFGVGAGRRFVPGTPVHGVSRSTNHLDLFATDVDGVTVTAAWEPFFFDGWHGWWEMTSGRAAPGAPVTIVSRGQNMLDATVVGADGEVCTSGWGPGRGPAWTPWTEIGS